MKRFGTVNRRELISAGVAFGLAGPVLSTRTQAQALLPIIVETTNGKLRGSHHNGVSSFNGIPYAADTSGKNRFMAPQPVESWTGVRNAIAMGDLCPQGTDPVSKVRVLSWLGHPGTFSENCCVLNVFTPNLNPNAKRHVMVWLHGGGFQAGGGGVPLYDGTNLAKAGDVVVVTVNHRLNTLGFANLGFLDPRFPDAANAGQLDLVAALRWVKDNIAAFGGNPDSVTIFGESGGGSKVTLLMGMPSAQGLFHRAINMSGVSGLGLPSAASTEPYVLELLRTLDISPNDVARLQDVPANLLVKAWGEASRKTRMTGAGPVIDGTHIPFRPMSPEGLKLHANIPYMMGNCDTEVSLFFDDMRSFDLTRDQAKARIMAGFGIDGATAEAAMERYAKALPGRTPTDILIAMGTDGAFRAGMIKGAETKANDRHAPVYFYDLIYKTKADNGVWRTPHAVDIPFVFGNTHQSVLLTGDGPQAAETSRRMQAAFVAFAKTGNPNNPLIPRWPQYDTSTRATMLFDVKPIVVNDFRGADRLANQGLRLTNSAAFYAYKD